MKIKNKSAFAKVLSTGGLAIAISALCLSTAGAQEAAQTRAPLLSTGPVKMVQSTDPARPATAPEMTAADRAYVSQMQGVIAASQTRGALDAAAMDRVFAAAFRGNVIPEAIGAMVSNLVTAYPDSLARICTSAMAPANGKPSMELVWQVMNSAVMSSPKPFTNVILVRDSVSRTVDFTNVIGMDNYIKYATARIASATPDNPMNGVAYNRQQIGTEHEQQGLALKARTKDQAKGIYALFLDSEVGLNPFFSLPDEYYRQPGDVSDVEGSGR